MVKRKIRHQTMSIICSFSQEEHDQEAYIDAKYLYAKGLPKGEDAEYILKILSAMGYLEAKNVTGIPMKVISLTPKGFCYLEEEDDKKREFWRSGVIIPTSLAVVTTLILKGLEQLLKLI